MSGGCDCLVGGGWYLVLVVLSGADGSVGLPLLWWCLSVWIACLVALV